MKILIVLAVAFAIYYFRRYWLTPWATYVSMTETSADDVFLTVRHIHWYPPFLSYESTYHSRGNGPWSEEKTGYLPSMSKRINLNCIEAAAKARSREMNDLMGGLR